MQNNVLRLASVLLVVAVCGAVVADDNDSGDATSEWLTLGETGQTGSEQASASTEEFQLFAGQPKGFLTGMKGFEKFVHPVSSPIYFFDPFIDTHVNLVYLWHKFPKGSNLKGGDLSACAVAPFIALTERLQLTATCDGYSRLRARALQPDEGWNDLALGLKYNLIADVENQFIASTGLTWRLSNGHARTLHGGVDELVPYVTAAKAFGKWQAIGTLGGRLPMDRHMGNYIVYENLHLAYELCENFFPLVEFNGVQYLSDGDRLTLGVGGLDYANIGSNNVSGNSTFLGAVGFRWKVQEHVEIGSTYEFPMSTRDNDIFDQRVTVSVIFGL